MKTGFFPLTDVDRPALIAHFLRLSSSDRRFRFGVTMSAEAISRFCRKLPIHYVHGYFRSDELIGVVILALESPEHVEFAVSVDPEHRGRGLAQLLLDFAVDATAEDHLVIHHAADNLAMRQVHRGYPSTRKIHGGEVDVDIDLRQLRAERQSAQNILCGAEA